MATMATIPRWQRRLAGLHQPVLVDAAIRPLMRLAFALAALSTRVQLTLLGLISPATRPVVAPILRGTEPRRPQKLTPAEARERYGAPTPRELYARLQAPATAPAEALTAVAGG